MIRIFATILLASGLAACANTAAMRTLATQTSKSATAEEGQMNDFIAASKQQNLDNATTLKSIRGQAAAEQAAANQALLAWKLAADKDLLAAQAFTTQAQPADIVASLTTTAPPPMTLDDGGSAAALEKANTVFTTMAKTPRLRDNITELYASGDAVYQALQAQKAAAKSSMTASP